MRRGPWAGTGCQTLNVGKGPNLPLMLRTCVRGVTLSQNNYAHTVGGPKSRKLIVG